MLSLGSVPDLLRLLAVPVFGWAAWRDIKTRRVPNRTWLPLFVLGVAALAIEAWQVLVGSTTVPVEQRLFLVRVGISIGLFVPLSYGFWWVGGFGGADAKALMVLAVLFPTFPTYYLPELALPVVVPTLGVFAMSVLSNTVVAGVCYPLVLTGRNALAGHVSKVMVFGRPVSATAVTAEYGRLLQTPEGFTRRGLDLDALRMYLAWRDTTLSALLADPARHRDPASIPAATNDPGDGAIATDGGTEAVDEVAAGTAAADADPWGAERFLADIEGAAYGTTPEQLRAGLEVLASEDTVWITPGIPFLVPMFVGLVVALTYGDALFAALSATGLV